MSASAMRRRGGGGREMRQALGRSRRRLLSARRKSEANDKPALLDVEAVSCVFMREAGSVSQLERSVRPSRGLS